MFQGKGSAFYALSYNTWGSLWVSHNDPRSIGMGGWVAHPCIIPGVIPNKLAGGEFSLSGDSIWNFFAPSRSFQLQDCPQVTPSFFTRTLPVHWWLQDIQVSKVFIGRPVCVVRDFFGVPDWDRNPRPFHLELE